MQQKFSWKRPAASPPPLKKSSLSPQRSYLLELMQALRYGRIRNLRIKDCEPEVTVPIEMVETVKMNCRNDPHPLMSAEDYVLKDEAAALFTRMDEIVDGLIETIDVQDGLPFRLEIHRRAAWSGNEI